MANSQSVDPSLEPERRRHHRLTTSASVAYPGGPKQLDYVGTDGSTRRPVEAPFRFGRTPVSIDAVLGPGPGARRHHRWYGSPSRQFVDGSDAPRATEAPMIRAQRIGSRRARRGWCPHPAAPPPRVDGGSPRRLVSQQDPPGPCPPGRERQPDDRAGCRQRDLDVLPLVTGSFTAVRGASRASGRYARRRVVPAESNPIRPEAACAVERASVPR